MNKPDHIGSTKWGSRPGTRKYIISGCGRSGTLFMSRVFRIMGREVGHENILRNGCSSWYLAESDHAGYVKKALDGHRVVYIHVVRNPLDVITSMWHCEHLRNREALDFVREYYPQWGIGRNLEGVVKYWIYWNALTAANLPISVTLPVEQLQYPDAFCAFCTAIGIKYQPKYFQKTKDLGNKTHTIRGMFRKSLEKTYGKEFLEPLTIEDIEDACSPDIFRLLQQVAGNYGYKIGDNEE